MNVGSVAIIGSGTMGKAIGKGLIDAGVPTSDLVFTARSANSLSSIAKELGVRTLESNIDAVRGVHVVILAVKPKDVSGVLAQISNDVPPDALIISIAAGVSLAKLQADIPGVASVIRAMPNTPCSIQKGLTVLSCGSGVPDMHLEAAKKIFQCLGEVFILDEAHMDTVTGLAASGPAFVFVFIESLADGAVARGLPRRVAIEMASQMVFGAASMVLASGKHPAALKDDVTTPAGCTIAGLLALEDGRIRSTISRAIEIASQRASELGG